MNALLHGRTLSLFLALTALLSLAFIACGDDDGDSEDTADSGGASTQSELEQEYEEAIANLDKEIEETKAELETAAEDAKPELEQQLEELEAARDEAKAELEELVAMTKEEFEAARDRFSESLDGIRSAWQDLFDRE